jgi:hypothetical protein
MALERLVSLRLESEEYETLAELAMRSGTSVSVLIRSYVERGKSRDLRAMTRAESTEFMDAVRGRLL